MATSIGAISFANPVMNAACSIAKSFDDLDALLATQAAAVVIGSITWEERAGNPEPRWFAGSDLGFALNSYGMPNNGHAWYEENLPEMVKRAHTASKPLVLSVAGFSVKEYGDLALLGKQAGVDMVELNLACPNTSEAGRPNPIFSFDLEMIQAVIDVVEKNLGDLPYSLKLSPYSNPSELTRTAELISKSKASAVVASNTFPNAYWQDENGQPLIGSNNGLAGASGEAMLPISLGQVKQFRAQLPATITVIGVGGASTPKHVQQYLQAGAQLVQVATHIVRNGHVAINELIES